MLTNFQVLYSHNYYTPTQSYRYQARAKPVTVTAGSKCPRSMNIHLVEVNGLFMPPISAVLDHWLLGGGLNPMALLTLVMAAMVQCFPVA